MGCMQSADFAAQQHQKPQPRAKKVTKKRKQQKAPQQPQRELQDGGGAAEEAVHNSDVHNGADPLHSGAPARSVRHSADKNEPESAGPPTTLDARSPLNPSNPFSPPQKAVPAPTEGDRRASSATDSSRNRKGNPIVVQSTTTNGRASASSPVAVTAAGEGTATGTTGAESALLGRSGGPHPTLVENNQAGTRRGLGNGQRVARAGECGPGLNALKLSSIRTWIDLSDTTELVDPQDVIGHERRMVRKLAQREQQTLLPSIQTQ